MKIIVGLGNPGEKYSNTRHNLGFKVVNLVAGEVEWQEESKLKSLVAKHTIKSEEVLLVKPQTYMNLSGQAVQRIIQQYRVGLDTLYIVYDELDLSLGDIRIRKGGGSGGHNGVASIIEAVGEDFYRIRLGIGRPEINQNAKIKNQTIEEYVLEEFEGEEKTIADEMVHETPRILMLLATEGYEGYMSKYNKKEKVRVSG